MSSAASIKIRRSQPWAKPLLRRCHQRSEELFTAAVGADGPTRQQIALLVTACQHPEASQAELVGLTGIDKNTLAQMIKRLTAPRRSL